MDNSLDKVETSTNDRITIDPDSQTQELTLEAIYQKLLETTEKLEEVGYDVDQLREELDNLRDDYDNTSQELEDLRDTLRNV